MKRLLIAFSIFIAAAIPANAAESADANSQWDGGDFARLPILSGGRIKPLDSFARNYLLLFRGRESADDFNSPIAWLAELLFDPARSYSRRVFKISNRAARDSLSLPHRDDGLYAFDEMAAAIEREETMLSALHQRDPDSFTTDEKQTAEAYLKTLHYFELSRSLSLLLPDFAVHSPELSRELLIPPGVPHTYLEMLPAQRKFESRAPALRENIKNGGELSESEIELVALARRLDLVRRDSQTRIFRVIPPQWDDNKEVWHSPWSLVEEGRGSPQSAQLFALWSQLAAAYRDSNAAQFHQAAEELRKATLTQSNANSPRLNLEFAQNQLHPFLWSLGFYLAAFLVLAAGWLGKGFRRTAFAMLCIGAMFHLLGIAARIYIMSRPPVATIYESVIFVGLVAVVFGVLLERSLKNGIGVLIGATLGAALHFIGRGYAAEGDTLQMLVAVLNTNFWLATHVVCMTIGYGCALAGGVAGHIYLLRRAFFSNDDKQRALHSNMLGMTLFAAFFSMFGTILGGIWADQSWGRFWGWDPKENGALLIVLWLFMLLHGHVARLIGGRGYALGMVFTNIIVALAWFGVNLLSVGLHSYGFTDGAAIKLALFCGGELLFGLFFYLLIVLREQTAAAKDSNSPPPSPPLPSGQQKQAAI